MDSKAKVANKIKHQISKFSGIYSFFGIPSFYSYAMADGIFNYLFDNKYGLFYKSKPMPPDYQLSIIWKES